MKLDGWIDSKKAREVYDLSPYQMARMNVPFIRPNNYRRYWQEKVIQDVLNKAKQVKVK